MAVPTCHVVCCCSRVNPCVYSSAGLCVLVSMHQQLGFFTVPTTLYQDDLPHNLEF